MPFQRKSIVSVKEGTLQAFRSMPVRFFSVNLCEKVKLFTSRHQLMDGSITRRLRELRKADPQQFGYIVVDNETGLYEKKVLNFN